jgi:acyl carrier protein
MGMVLAMDVRAAVISTIEGVAKEQHRELAPLTDDAELINAGLDSLCLAVVVARLEDRLGVDPFSALEDGEFPVTLGDFVRMYENACG